MTETEKILSDVEAKLFRLCAAMVLLYLAVAWLIPAAWQGALAVAALFACLAFKEAGPMLKHRAFVWRLLGKNKRTYTYEQFRKLISKSRFKNDFWLGDGFLWEQSQCQKANDLNRCDMGRFYQKEVVREEKRRLIFKQPWELVIHPIRSRQKLEKIQQRVSQVQGFTWLQALESSKHKTIREEEIFKHVLLVGSSGSGKTSFLKCLIAQFIQKDYVVFVVDPKGDADLFNVMREYCEIYQREFQFFSVAKPEESTPIDLTANFGRGGEVATRLASVLPRKDESDPFPKLCENALRAVVGGMLILEERPTCENIYYNLLGRVRLAVRVLTYWLTQKLKIAEADLPKGKSPEETLEVLESVYESRGFKSPEVTSVIDLAHRSDAILDKTITSIKDLLGQLTRDGYAPLLSPSFGNPKAFTDTRKLVARNAVFYLGTDTLKDQSMARTLGALFLTDLASVAGDIYNEGGKTNKKIAVIVDEASEVCCDALIALLSKARGAGIAVVVATQSIADFTARLGSEAQTDRVLANVATRIVMRLQDSTSRKFFAEKGPVASIYTKTRSHAVTATSESLLPQGMNHGERETELPHVPLIESHWLTSLPDGESFMTSSGYVSKLYTPRLVK